MGPLEALFCHFGAQPTGQSVKIHPGPKIDRNLSVAKPLLKT